MALRRLDYEDGREACARPSGSDHLNAGRHSKGSDATAQRRPARRSTAKDTSNEVASTTLHLTGLSEVRRDIISLETVVE